jgi:predicted RNase H-like HicB family nuclease
LLISRLLERIEVSYWSEVASTTTQGILFEKIESGEFPPSFYYAHVPALGLTTHGEGIEAARAAAEDLVKLWLAEKRAAGESVEAPSNVFLSTIEISENAVQSA